MPVARYWSCEEDDDRLDGALGVTEIWPGWIPEAVGLRDGLEGTLGVATRP